MLHKQSGEALSDVRAAVASLGAGQPLVLESIVGFSEAGDVYRVETAQGGYALRVYANGGEMARDADAVVLGAVAKSGLPVPKVVATGWARGRALLLTDWCPGRTVLAELLTHPKAAEGLGRIFGAAQAAIHRVDAPSVLRMAQADGLPRGERLLHLDFHPANVLTDGDSITGIVDWENARSGDPRLDVARTLSLLRLAAPAFVPHGERPTLVSFARGYAQGYREHSDPLPRDMAPFYAWAGDFMLRDLARKADADLLRRVRRWTRWWTRMAETSVTGSDPA